MRLERRLFSGGFALLTAAGLCAAAGADDPALVAAGREVYIAEGCMHCHSQYIRPGTPDVVRWGPARAFADMVAGAPPLPGNRRQGPDLLNVGNRRSPVWNRLHLTDPRAVSPGSRMPSYVHLFQGDAARGEALLAYLASLGRDTLPERAAQAAAWQPATLEAREPKRAAVHFAQLCAPCHGPAGRGDGPLAESLGALPRNLLQDRWRTIDAPAGSPAERLALARVIKFGLPATAMAGHEYLPDDAIVSLAAFLQARRAAPPPP